MSTANPQNKSKEFPHIKLEITDDEIKLILRVFETVEKDPLAYDFLQPVDYIALNILDYPKIITNPMDLGTVKKNLIDKEYPTFKEFLDDINLIWNNCRTYNLPGSEIVKMANHCEKLFNRTLEKTFKNYKSKKVNKNDNEKLTQNEKVKLAYLIRQQTNEILQKIVKLLIKEAPKAIDDTDNDKFKIKLELIEYKVYDMIIKLIESLNETKETLSPTK